MLRISKIKNVKTPERGTEQSAGIDFFVPNDFNNGKEYYLCNSGDILIPSGIKVEIPKGHVLIAFNKSGISTKTGLRVGACVVDEDYHGEIHLHVYNTDNRCYTIEPGMKLVQFVLLPVSYLHIEEVPIEVLYSEASQRGSGAFGSTGN